LVRREWRVDVSVKNIDTSKSSVEFSRGYEAVFSLGRHTLRNNVFNSLLLGTFLLASFLLFTKLWKNEWPDAFDDAWQNGIAGIEEP
jgi:hypothetical protein